MTVVRPHVLVIPFPAQGHMIPLLDLTHKLAAAADSNLTITVLTTPKNQTFLTPLLSAHPSTIHPLLLPFPSHPSLPPGIENAKDMPNSLRTILLSFSNLHQPLLHWFNSHPSPPQFIISDMFCGWTQNLAEQLNIHRIVFSPSGAFAYSTFYYLWNHLPKRVNPTDKNEIVSYHGLPNSPKYPWWQVSPLFRSYVDGDHDSKLVKDWYLGNMKSWGLVVNSFSEFEKPYLDYLKKELGHDRVWAVGPLLPVNVNNGDDGDDDGCDDWAAGLDASRGLVIRGWAPQVVILRHKAVGAFLTHCGWNSVVESVDAGVPVLAWPMSADQFVDATLLVEELKVAEKVCEGEKTVPDSDLLSRVMAESVGGTGEETRKKMLQLQAKAVAAIREGGSSDKDLRCLMEHLQISL